MLVYTAHRRIGFVRMLISMAWLFLLLVVPVAHAQAHILTNHHVAGGATEIEVLLANGHTYPARLVGTDPKTDLAVIKIDAKEALPSVTFGDSDAIGVGEWVVAIGHPRGLDQTVTHGIISAKHRRGISDPSSYQDF